ncbi:MAG: hypothetical protein WCI37_00780 [bacterium]
MYLNKLANQGDTLIEVLIAISIIGSVIIGDSASVNSSNSNLFSSQVREQALVVLQNQMELLKAANYDNIFTASYLCSTTSCTTSPKHFCIYYDVSLGLQVKSVPSPPLNCYFNYTGTYLPSSTSGYFSIDLTEKYLSSSGSYQYNGVINWNYSSSGITNNANISYELATN